MELIAIALIFLTSVLLLVSLTYIIITTRHKEKMLLIEKGLDPQKYLSDRLMPNVLRIGLFMIGLGIGFLSAFLLDEYVMVKIDNPAIYPSMVFLFGGISQVIFYAFFSKNINLK